MISWIHSLERGIELNKSDIIECFEKYNIPTEDLKCILDNDKYFLYNNYFSENKRIHYVSKNQSVLTD